MSHLLSELRFAYALLETNRRLRLKEMEQTRLRSQRANVNLYIVKK